MKTAIVTGASSGLGFELCRNLLARGYRVAMFSRDAEQLDLAAKVLSSKGPTISIAGDVTDIDQLRAAVLRIEAIWGPIDLAIANAGIRTATPAANLSLEHAKSIMSTNYFGLLHLYDAAIPGMLIRKGGCFVGIASLAGIRCLPGGSAYSASKAAMQAFLDTVRVELAPEGIQVVTVNPWFIQTGHKDNTPRPGEVSASWAANTIIAGIERGTTQIDFPLLPSLLWKIIRFLPNSTFAWLIGPGKRGLFVKYVRRMTRLYLFVGKLLVRRVPGKG